MLKLILLNRTHIGLTGSIRDVEFSIFRVAYWLSILRAGAELRKQLIVMKHVSASQAPLVIDIRCLPSCSFLQLLLC